MEKKMKKKSLIILGSVAVVIILIVSIFVGSYNGLVTANEDVNGKAANIQTQLQRRGDLIPNLVNTVKGYAAHEEKIFTEVADARSKLAGANGVKEQSEANAQLDGAISRLLMVVERYPDLKANQNFMDLQDELAGTENRIAVARKDYNDSAKKYNTDIRRFPKNIFASMFGFKSVDYFEASEGSQQVPNVNFGS
ncbi:MAG: LemA family protein [Oscillospiraceae bacterium]